MRLKRVFDLAGAAGGLVFFLPVMMLVAVAIVLDDGLPLVFRQARLGRRRRRFTILKFRSMRDGRVTRVGRVLRHTGLDELPQFINVLRGEMSVIGPRPERPCFVEQFEREIPGYQERHRIRPGITGLAQVNGGYLSNARVKLRYDLFYLYHRSVWLDLMIVARTFGAMIH